MGLAGNLRDLSITNLIELSCVEKTSSQLTVKTRSGDAIVFFDRGNIVHARWGDLKGTAALYHILRLSDGEFRVASNVAPPERTIFESWKGLVLDGMRVLDETQRIKNTIAHSLAEELQALPGVARLLVVSKDGTVVHQQGAADPERAYAISALVTAQGAVLSDTLHFGPLSYAAYVRGNDKEFVFNCDPFLVLLAVPRAADIRPTSALIETIRAKLKSSEHALGAESDAEPEKAVR
jgi:predicted regulator of Ras-like GTPase activity (Roadblock/LC7/MglB family)